MRPYYPEYWSFLVTVVLSLGFLPSPVGFPLFGSFAEWPLVASVAVVAVAISVVFHFTFDAYAMTRFAGQGETACLSQAHATAAFGQFLRRTVVVATLLGMFQFMGRSSAIALSVALIAAEVGYWLSLFSHRISRQSTSAAASLWRRLPATIAAGTIDTILRGRFASVLLVLGLLCGLSCLLVLGGLVVTWLVALSIGLIVVIWAELIHTLRPRAMPVKGPAVPLSPWSRIALPLGVIALFALCQPSREEQHEAFRRNHCISNLNEISRAISSLRRASGRLLPSCIRDQRGTPLLSWRVQLLPELGCGDLYSRINRHEAWNSPHNRAIIEACDLLLPFRCPGSSDDQLETDYILIFDCGLKVPAGSYDRPQDSSNDPTNTIMILEIAHSGIPWAEPRDATVAETGRLIGEAWRAGMPSPHPDGFHAIMQDGRVVCLPTRVVKNAVRDFMEK